jgi:cell division control protein 6
VASSLQSLVSVFSLAQSNPSSLRVIGIANTHTLTSSVSQFSIHGISGVNTLHFSPYAPPQLLHILQSRLAPLYQDKTDPLIADRTKKFLPPATLTLLTKKIAAQTGDVRALFEVARGAIDLAVASPPSVDANPLNTTPVVTPMHILSALKAYTPAARTLPSSATPLLSGAMPKAAGNSETVTKVQNLGFQARLVLLSLLLASERREAGLALSSSPSPKSPVKRTQSAVHSTASQGFCGFDSTQLHAYYAAILSRAENEIFTPVSRSEFGDLLGMLETVGTATLSPSLPARSVSPSKGGRRTFGRTASFGGASGKARDQGQEVRLLEGVRCGEVLRGLGIGGEANGEGCKDIREEEVRAIWEREKARLTRDAKAKTRANGSSAGDVFDGAMED